MANFLSGGSSGRVNSPPVAATSLRVQNAVQGQPIAIVHGQNRLAGNLVDYWGFKSTAQSSGGGGKGGILGGGGKGSGTTGYTYSVSTIFGLCEGPLDSIIMGWNSKSPFALDVNSNGQIFVPYDGWQGQAAWPYAVSSNGNHALGYSSLAYVGGEDIQLGNSPELSNYNWEVRGAIARALTETYTVSSPYTFTPAYFSLASSVLEQATVPPVAPYTVQAAIQGAPSTLPSIQWASQGGAAPSHPYQIFTSLSCGVFYTDTGVPLTHVSGTPSAGQFTVTGGASGSGSTTGGLYTFNAADAAAAVTLVDFIVSPGVNYAYQPTGNIVSGSTSVGSLSSMTGIDAGELVSGSGIPLGAVVQAVGASSITLSRPATATATGVTLTVIGAALNQVLGTPAKGQFSLSAQSGSFGQYTFSAADAGADLVIVDVPDADPALSLVDYLTNPRYGVGFPSAYIGNLSALQDYAFANGLFVSPAITGSEAANSWLADFSTGLNGAFVWSSGLLTFVPYGDTAISGNGRTYTPPSVIYSLVDDDLLPNEGTSSVGVSSFTSDDPVVCVRKRQSDAMNDVKIEFLDRGNAYNPAIVEAQDDAAINQFGLRAADTKTLHFFCIDAAALTSAQLQLGRQQIRNQYSFTVPWYFILLDPMDVIEISDAALGLDALTVRIIEITENQQDWSLTITAEDYLVGTGTTPLYGSQPKAGYVPNYNVAPGALVEPVIFEPPVQLSTGGGLEIWLLGGGDGTVGGWDVYVSLDGNTYQNVGRQTGGNRVGFTNSTLPSAANPDTVDTVGVDLTATQGALSPGTAQDAEAAVTLCYLGGYPVPPAPTLGAMSGGSLAAATYYARATYIFAGGEGPASAEESVAVAANELLTVASPTTLSGATGWNLYVATASGAEALQNTTPIAIGTGWTEPASGLVSGAAPPAATAGYELISYEGATLSSQYIYTLGTYLGRGLYGSTISAHDAGTQFARLDGTQFTVSYNKAQIGQTIYVKLLPFNPWGGGQPDLASVQPYLHVIEGPPAPGTVQNFQGQQNGGSVLLSWSDLPFPVDVAYDILYGAVGATVAQATLIAEASRSTSETTVAVPPGTWTLYIRGHDLASGLVGPASAVTVTVSDTNAALAVQQNAPDWLGAKSGFLVHYTGVLVPDCTRLANQLTAAQLFAQPWLAFPVASPSYTAPVVDTGFDDTLRLWTALSASPAPGASGTPDITFGLATWPAGGSDPLTYPPWTIGTVLCEFFQGQLVENSVVPAVVTELTITADAPTVTEAVQGFAVASVGTALIYAAEGIGPFHGPPTVLVTPTDGVSTSGGASAVNSTSCFIQLFSGGSPVAGTCNIGFIGA